MKGLKKDMVEHKTGLHVLDCHPQGGEESTFFMSHPPDLNNGTQLCDKTDPQSTVFPVIRIIWLSFFHFLNFQKFLVWKIKIRWNNFLFRNKVNIDRQNSWLCRYREDWTQALFTLMDISKCLCNKAKGSRWIWWTSLSAHSSQEESSVLQKYVLPCARHNTMEN